MAHFASVDWNNPSGLVASLSKTSVTAATGTSAAEGTDKLTYTTVRLGVYRISAYVVIRTAGTGASQAVIAQVAYTDNLGAKTAGTIATTGVTATALDLTSATARTNQSQVIQATSGTAITVTMSGSGTFTSAGIYDLYVTIEAL